MATPKIFTPIVFDIETGVDSRKLHSLRPRCAIPEGWHLDREPGERVTEPYGELGCFAEPEYIVDELVSSPEPKGKGRKKEADPPFLIPVGVEHHFTEWPRKKDWTFPGTHKTPEARLRWLQDKVDEFNDRGALDVRCAQILAIGLMREDNSGKQKFEIMEGTEAQILEGFWSTVRKAFQSRKYTLIGFNSREFDLPMIIARSQVNDIRVPAWAFDKWDPFHVDLTQFLQKEMTFTGLGATMRNLRMEGKVVSGHYFDWLYEELPKQAIEYLREDLVQTMKLAKRILPV